ncbi:MAG: hypothetical protein ACRCZI_00655, partial [Cetobacterium sp.]
CVDDAGLPPVHNTLLRTTKSRVYATLGNLFTARVPASAVHLNPASAPMATTRLVDEVFHNYQPYSDGFQFAKGLPPLAIVCHGHPAMNAHQELIAQAQMVESGATVSLADATTLSANRASFPSCAVVAAEKLYGWSIVLDVFHGVHHPMAISVRAAVCLLGPSLLRLERTMSNANLGMDVICRVMFDMQQDYMSWVRSTSNGIATAVPDFQRLINLVDTHRASCLAALPSSWYMQPGAPVLTPPSPPAGGPPAGGGPAQAAGGSNGTGGAGGSSGSGRGAPVVNASVDPVLKRRYDASGHTSIGALLGGRTVTVPQRGGKDICLTWALRGSCNSGCKRADNHVRYSVTINRAIGTILNECGVPDPQP